MGAAGGGGDDEARWAPGARRYLESVRDAISGLGAATLSPDAAVWRQRDDGGGGGGGGGEDGPSYRVPLLSDRFRKSNNPPTSSWSFPFRGGSSLSLVPIGSFGHLRNAGLARQRANGSGGSVLPMLDVAVLFDGSQSSGGSSGDDDDGGGGGGRSSRGRII